MVKATTATYAMDNDELTIATDGLQIVPKRIPRDLLARLSDCFPADASNVRNALELTAIRELSHCQILRDLVVPVLGERCFAVRAILFNKTGTANWKVAWHQDVVIAVRSRATIAGFGPWSVKLGVDHVRPPPSVLENMLAVRVHLDDCGDNNGPLRILPGTHSLGVLSDSEISGVSKDREVVCSVQRGDLILMRPLILHASSAAREANSRRVVHIEFAAQELPAPLEWQDTVRANG
jgi:ectoine hydroxylase-related dioxygenase (phytanoyl-CoA dioxygenase family)